MTGSESFFEALKSHRESQNIEISEICDFTKITPKYIQAIENGDFQVLPNVYMRLFLRAYAEYIGADTTKALEDYELHTTGKIKTSKNISIKPVDVESNDTVIQEFSLDSSSQITPKQIVSGAVVILGLFLILYWAGKITQQQTENVGGKPAQIEESAVIQPTEETGTAAPLNEVPEKNSQPVQEEPIEKEVDNWPPILPNKLPLNENDFLAEKRDRELTSILKLFPPYTISILTLQETKLNISKSMNGELTELINQVTPGGEEYNFEFESIIHFEFWSSRHIQVKLNEIPIDNFLLDGDMAIRGSYEVENTLLYLGFYQH